MSSLAISIENVSKIYRLGEINRSQFFGDVRRWAKSKFNPDHTFGDPETEAEQEPKAPDLFYALKDINFDIKQGETVAIIGANGAGKSTLLKIISRITAPSKGVVRINGRIGSLLEVGTGFQGDLTGRDNVYMNGAILGMSRREVASKFDDIVSFSGVERFIDTPVKRYSSGMNVRLAFAVAAFLEPEILIVDEVLSVGDQQFQNKCMQRLQDIIKDGRTVIFVSHGAGQVRQLCTRAICLKQGEVICDDEPNKALEYYQNSVRESGMGANGKPGETKKSASEIVYEENERPGNENVKIISARFVNKENNSIEESLTSEEFFFEMVFKVHESGFTLRPGCTFSDELGNILFWTGDVDSPQTYKTTVPGIYKTSLQIPAHFLSPGKVIVTVGIGEDSSTGDVHAMIKEPLTFYITENFYDLKIRGCYKGVLPGFIQPKLNWKTEIK